MRIFITFVGLLLAALVQKGSGHINIPEKCEDVLSVKVCGKLEITAKNLKLTSQQVKEAIVDAIKKGKSKSEEIYQSASEFLQNKVLNKKCEDFTSNDTCTKLRALAAKLKIQANKVEEFVIRAIAEGSLKAVELYSKVVDYYKKEIATKTCEDFLTQAQCDRLRSVAKVFKLKVNEIEQTIVTSISNAYIEGKDAVTETFNKFKELVKDTSCEDLLNPTVCSALRKYAALTKVAFPKIMEAVKDAIIKGYKLGKGLLKAVYSVVDYFYDCDDVFTKSSCDRLKYWLGKAGMKVAEINNLVREYAKKGITKASEIYHKIYEFLKNKVVCKITPWCKSTMKRSAHSVDVEAIATIQSYIQKIMKLASDGAFKIAGWLKHTVASLNNMIADVIVKIAAQHQKPTELLRKVAENVRVFVKEFMAKTHNHLKELHKNIMELFGKLLENKKTKRDADDEADDIEAIGKLANALVDEEFMELRDEIEKVVSGIAFDDVTDDEIMNDEQRQKRSLAATITDENKKITQVMKNYLYGIQQYDVQAFLTLLKEANSKMTIEIVKLYNEIKN